MRDELTLKQKKFCYEYISTNGNGTQAAIRAGYSKDTAKEMAYENLAKPHINNFIKELESKILNKLEVTAEMVIAEFAKIAFSDLGNFVGDNNSIVDVKDEDLNIDTSVLSSLKTTYTKDGFSTEIKLHSKISALENLGKHLGLYEKDNKQKAIDAIRIIRE